MKDGVKVILSGVSDLILCEIARPFILVSVQEEASASSQQLFLKVEKIGGTCISCPLVHEIDAAESSIGQAVPRDTPERILSFCSPSCTSIALLRACDSDYPTLPGLHSSSDAHHAARAGRLSEERLVEARRELCSVEASREVSASEPLESRVGMCMTDSCTPRICHGQ